MKTIDSKTLKESNDCTVRAIAAACKISYSESHNLCRDAGRKNNKGISFHFELLPELKKKYQVTILDEPKQPNGHSYTPKTIEKLSNLGPMICQCRGHVFAVVNGKVKDWVDNRKHRITCIYLIKPLSKVTKKDRAQKLFLQHIDESRQTIINLFIKELDMTKAGASTYYSNCKKELT